MRPKEAFNYNNALNQLIQLRYQARQQGSEETTPEIMELERQIYSHLRSGATKSAEGVEDVS